MNGKVEFEFAGENYGEKTYGLISLPSLNFPLLGFFFALPFSIISSELSPVLKESICSSFISAFFATEKMLAKKVPINR